MKTSGIVTALTPEELRALLLVTRRQDFSFYVLVLIATCHGLRVSEVINLTRSDFSTGTDGTYLTVQRLKGSKRTVQKLITTPNPLMDEATVVTAFIAKMKPEDCLFCNSGERMTRFQALYLIKKYGLDAGIAPHKLTVRSLKHTAGTLMRLTGSTIEDIADHLGHENINNSRIYMNNTAEEVHTAASRAFLGVSRRIRAGVPKAFTATAGG